MIHLFVVSPQWHFGMGARGPHRLVGVCASAQASTGSLKTDCQVLPSPIPATLHPCTPAQLLPRGWGTPSASRASASSLGHWRE